jgi:hypothetical protein
MPFIPWLIMPLPDPLFPNWEAEPIELMPLPVVRLPNMPLDVVPILDWE